VFPNYFIGNAQRLKVGAVNVADTIAVFRVNNRKFRVVRFDSRLETAWFFSTWMVCDLLGQPVMFLDRGYDSIQLDWRISGRYQCTPDVACNYLLCFGWLLTELVVCPAKPHVQRLAICEAADVDVQVTGCFD
jgi:hypothetical protein